MNRTITCRNDDGYELTFGETGFDPFLLETCDGCYSVKNNVTMSDNTMLDGATYQGSVAAKRNIVLGLRDRENYTDNRNTLNKLFKSASPGTLIYRDGINERTIAYYVESINSDGLDRPRRYTVSLLCDDPFFYALDDVEVMMASWEKAFEFQHQFLATKEELGYRSAVRSQEIYNENATDEIGLTITIECTGAVENPKITHVESGESITVGSTAHPFVLESGDVLVITTQTNNKHVKLTSGGVTTEVNEYLTEDSEFIQLQRGYNNIGYSASSGESNMAITLSYRMRYASA